MLEIVFDNPSSGESIAAMLDTIGDEVMERIKDGGKLTLDGAQAARPDGGTTMRTSLWMVIVVVGVWLGFLFGYAVSSHSGTKGRGRRRARAPAASAGGYGR